MEEADLTYYYVEKFNEFVLKIRVIFYECITYLHKHRNIP